MKIDRIEYDILLNCIVILDITIAEWLENDMKFKDVIEAALRKLCHVE